jgi:hypothetical protein
VKKSTGLGISEFFLRFMAWLCLYNDDYRDSQMVIVTGPNIDLAIKLIKRMKGLFLDKLGVIFDSKETKLDKLLTGLRTAVANEYKLDKENTVYDDLVDAFRLALQFYKMTKG